MNKILSMLALGLFVSGTAFAAAPKGNGNFRRAEALKAAGATSKTARVIGLTTSDNRVAGPKNLKTSRVLFVQDGSKVTLVKAPTDSNKAVTKMTQAQVKRLGLVTQAQAKKIAEQTTGGLLGTNGKVKVVAAGMGAKRGSYLFTQVSPKSETVKEWGSTYKATQITRSVSITGKGESANAAMTKIGK